MELQIRNILKKPWVIALTAVLLLVAAGLLIWCNNVFEIQIQLGSASEVSLEYGSQYIQPEAAGTFSGSLLYPNGFSVPVTCEGTVDTSKVGDYQLTYTANQWGYTESKSMTVHVVDTQPPVIQLVSDPESFTLPGREYWEEGFRAFDNYDGDITHRVIRTQTDTEVVYTVTDSAGNQTQCRRTILYKDPDPPVIVLKGEPSMTVRLGTKFQEPGYSAWDAVDGELTEAVTVTGEVNTEKQGEYALTYSVKDAYGNETVLTRVVKVQYIPPDFSIDPNLKPVGGTVYLTFDDGPGYYTRRLLEILAKYNVKATFFVVNTGYIDLISEIAAQGHSIGIHSITHNYSQIYASEEAFFKDLYGMQEIIRQKTGITTTLMRFPGGSSNMVSSFNYGIMTRLTQAVTEKGFQYFDWNVSSGDAGGAATPEQVYWNVVYKLARTKTSVVLQHDIKGFSVEAVEQIIIWGLENGYTFQALTPSSPGCHHNVNN